MKLDKLLLKSLKRLNVILNQQPPAFGRNWKMFPMKEYANDLIYKTLTGEKPAMIARIGSTEMLCIINYLGVKNPAKYKNYKSYIKGITPPWWWEDSMISQMQLWSGFFPGTVDKIEQFCELMLTEMKEVDILGSWLKEENFFREELLASKKVMLEDLEPFFTNNPWTKVLKSKKILVVHPFAETIQQQYIKHDQLFDNGLLPEFELITIKAVQSIAGEKTVFTDWFQALEWMKSEIEKVDFDICILGCGAYGFPLAAHVKRMGKKAIHLGGASQLLFGIKGKRWEEYIVYPYTNLYNNHWVRPGENEKPKQANVVEGACYW
jgi:hypothetical protein